MSKSPAPAVTVKVWIELVAERVEELRAYLYLFHFLTDDDNSPGGAGGCIPRDAINGAVF